MALGYVRPAREEDVDEIARIQLSTWRTAYTDVVPAAVLRELTMEYLAEGWRDACAQPPRSAHQVFVAVEQSEDDRADVRCVGFAAVGPEAEDEADLPADAADDQVGAVVELLVEPRFARRGHGSRLLSASVAHWREHGLAVARAWVFVRDSASLDFYKSAGWEADGMRRILDMAGEEVPQLRLHADVTDPA
ncbi:MAG: GNAT family N-acetyltransferase [Stackebrandtia sp.]